MDSCIYEGRVRHTRKSPAVHTFDYRLFLMYLDLDELPEVFAKRWFWSASRPALARFRRRDHLGPEQQSLADSVRDLVEAETACRPDGPIRLLTNLSYYGFCFNPVSFYYCFSADGESLDYIVTEVNNTPWGERDTTVLDCRCEPVTPDSWRFSPTKTMHVSPFMPMDIDYDWVVSRPDERLSVFMANSRNGERLFNATLLMSRKPIDGRSLAGVLIRFPFMTLKTIGAIYWEALRLFMKRVPVYAHPDKEKEAIAR